MLLKIILWWRGGGIKHESAPISDTPGRHWATLSPEENLSSEVPVGIMKSPWGLLRDLWPLPTLLSCCLCVVDPDHRKKADDTADHCETWRGPRMSRPAPQGRSKRERGRIPKLETPRRASPSATVAPLSFQWPGLGSRHAHSDGRVLGGQDLNNPDFGGLPSFLPALLLPRHGAWMLCKALALTAPHPSTSW